MGRTLYFRAPGERRRLPAGLDAVVHLDEAGVPGHPVHHRLDQLFTSPVSPPPAAMDLLLAAVAVWAADKLFPRSQAPDAWTRRIALHLPAASSFAKLAAKLENLLNFLTGDLWTLKFREGGVNLGLAGAWPHAWRPDAAALFSGGLDSLAGAIDLLEKGQRLVLVSHYDYGQLASLQQTLAEGLSRHYGPGRLHHLAVRVQFPESPELTLRSRSLLYLALGLATAAAFGPGLALFIPENGWISLNPPLTLNRLGTYSTRTTHPYFIGELRSLWQAAGLDHPLINPYEGLTKGEVLAGCRNQELLRRLFPLSLSCARPVAARWRRERAGACGYCYPCLVRRAALHRLGWDDGRGYRVDALADPELLRQRVRGSDLRALLMALRTWEEAPRDIWSRLVLPGSGAQLAAHYDSARQVLSAGFEELGQFIKDKGTSLAGSWAGEKAQSKNTRQL